MNIIDLGKRLGLSDEDLIPYGWDKAKIDVKDKGKLNKKGRLVLVTAITPTKAGEGKTTTTIGLHDGLRSIGVNSLAVLREPSLGPVFGVKGGAVGALKSTIVPSDDINLHFTGDFHALTSTINLIAAMTENHVWQGNELNIDPAKIVWPRALDMNDRSLREIWVNAAGKLPTLKDALRPESFDDPIAKQEFERNYAHRSEFVITVASELMAVFCIANDEEDFLDRAEKMIVAYTYDDKPVTVGDLHIRGAIKKLMAQALKPNLVQTLEENPVIVHGGPFANIAHGCNSVIATKLALSLADVVVTEAGFGADLGAEKFLDIKCQRAGLVPDAIVLVATVRALKLHGGVPFDDLGKENLQALEDGFPNLLRHAQNMAKYGVPVIVAINRFPSDTEAEIEKLKELCEDAGFPRVKVNEAAIKGSEGSKDLAKELMDVLDAEGAHLPGYENEFKPLYSIGDPKFGIKKKIETICREIYRAERVEYSELAEKQIADYEKRGYGGFAVCVAKTPNSFTDDPKILNAPVNFTMHVREVRLSAGAGFIVPLTGSVMTMPGLPKRPLAERM